MAKTKNNSSFDQAILRLVEPPKPKKGDTKPAPKPLGMEQAFLKVALNPPKPKTQSNSTGGTASSTSPLAIQFKTEAAKPLSQRVAENPSGPWSMKTLTDTGNLKPYQAPVAGNTTSAADAAVAPMPEQPKPPELSPMAGTTATVEGNASGFRTKKSRAKQDRTLNQGTSRFKINANSTNTGLNIGRGNGMANLLRGNL